MIWAAISLAAVAGTGSGPQSFVTPDLVVFGGTVLTVDNGRPRAEAFAVLNGKFVAVGSSAEMKRLAGSNTQLLDLHGRTVAPGFIDCHMHPTAIYPADSPLASVPLDPSHVHSMAELIAALKLQAARVPKGYMVRGTRYDDAKLGRHPTRFDLDQASTDHPISITQVSGHITVVNSLALSNAGITKDTPNPPGGAYDRTPDGVPNGVCRESANLHGKGGPSLQPDPPSKLEGLQRCFQNFLAKGLTSVADAAASPESLRSYQELQRRGCPVRINVMLLHKYLPALEQLGIDGPLGSAHLRLGTIKVFHGNSLSGRTCWVSQAYKDRPDYFGIPPAATQAELNDVILGIHKAGFQVAVHSNGDREIAMVLTAFENAQRVFHRKDPRFRIEHCSVCTPEILRRAEAIGAVLVFHSYMWENGDKLAEFGAERYDWLAPMARARQMGIHTTSHSDYSVSAADPLLRIQDLATRRTEAGVVIGAGQCISVAEAIRAWTLDAAYATFEEDSKGSIVPGKVADFVILGADPTRVPVLTIRKIPVIETWIDGKQAWKRESARSQVQAVQDSDED